MSTQTLQAQIQALNASLKQTSTVDAQTRDSLLALQREIEAFLAAHGADTLTDRLERLAVRFENDHPAVGSALRQAIDALAKAGI